MQYSLYRTQIRWVNLQDVPDALWEQSVMDYQQPLYLLEMGVEPAYKRKKSNNEIIL